MVVQGGEGEGGVGGGHVRGGGEGKGRGGCCETTKNGTCDTCLMLYPISGRSSVPLAWAQTLQLSPDHMCEQQRQSAIERRERTHVGEAASVYRSGPSRRDLR